ncbi:MAG: hypothetical protein AAF483_07895 [Planctomycetota bacterium]
MDKRTGPGKDPTIILTDSTLPTSSQKVLAGLGSPHATLSLLRQPSWRQALETYVESPEENAASQGRLASC